LKKKDATKKQVGSKRSRTKYPGLVKEVNPRTRWEYLDQDYVDKLSDKEKEFLSNFNEEWLSGNFNHPGRKLHRTKKSRRECYGRNNARNRDLFTINRTRGWIEGIAENQEAIDKARSANPENALIELIDMKKKLEES
jgi:hypothetical protein